MECLFVNLSQEAARIPRAALCQLARQAARQHSSLARAQINVVFVTRAESRRLNHTYRGKNKPTNVLSFTADSPTLTGDILICPEIARKEAMEQGIRLQEWISYLFVHGLLHLAGFDHQNEHEAARMEKASNHLLRRRN